MLRGRRALMGQGKLRFVIFDSINVVFHSIDVRRPDRLTAYGVKSIDKSYWVGFNAVNAL